MFEIGDILKNHAAPAYLFKVRKINPGGRILLQWTKEIKEFDSRYHNMHQIALSNVVFDGTINEYSTSGFSIFAHAPDTIQNMILTGKFK